MTDVDEALFDADSASALFVRAVVRVPASAFDAPEEEAGAAWAIARFGSFEP